MRVLSVALSAALLVTLSAPAAHAAVNRLPAMRMGPQDIHQTKVRFLPENVDSWFARWHILKNATQSIDITYFNFYKDPFGLAVLGLVKEKAAEGVNVRLMVDSRGSLSLSTRFFAQAYLRDLASLPNVQVKVFKPLTSEILRIPRYLRTIVAANHDKLMLVDGEWAVMGGRNLGEHYFTAPSDSDEAYRDMDLMLQGEGVSNELRDAFEIEFNHLRNYDVKGHKRGSAATAAREVRLANLAMDQWMNGGGLIDPESMPNRKSRKFMEKLNKKLGGFSQLAIGYADFAGAPWASDDSDYPVRILDKQSFGDPKNDITANLMAAINGAQESIEIQSAYLVLTDKLHAAFKAASDRGVKINILTNSPKSTGNVLVQAFFVRDWKQWLHEIPNLTIRMVEDNKIHTKAFVFDHNVAMIGSYNLDPMSETINSEVVAMFAHEGFATMVRERLEADAVGSVKCQIQVGADGELIGVVGPDDYLTGITGKFIKLLSKIGWLQPLV